MRGRTLVLAYHGIRPSGEAPAGEHVLHLEQARFNEQLDVLGELTRVVSLDEALTSAASEDDRPRVAITWDDAYSGAVSLGVDALVSRGMPATVFVSPGRLGGQAFWWDRLAMKHGGSIPAVLRERILSEFAGDDRRMAQELEGPAAGSLPAWVRSADTDMLARSASRPGITLASHTWSHVNLDAVDRAHLEEELRLPLRWLEERVPASRPWLSLPYGLGSAKTCQHAVSCGYAAVFKIRGGWIQRDRVDPISVPRLNIPAGLSTDGFVLRLRGMFCR